MKFWISSLLLVTVLVAGCRRAPEPAAAPKTTAPVTTQTVAVTPPVPAPPPPPKPLETPPAPPASDVLLEQAATLKGQGKLVEARDLLQPLVLATNAADKVLAALGEINTQLLFSGAPAANKTNYVIQAGDSLGKIAKTFGTTIELLMKSNGLTARDMIRAGNRLRIYQGKFAVDVSKAANVLTLTDNGVFFKRYRVGTGQFSKTPVGEFKITNRAEHPVWYRPSGMPVPFGDPENILGTHWLGLDVPGYGLHGTWEANSIGKQSSAGCIRMLNDDVGELYVILPVGTPVTIHE